MNIRASKLGILADSKKAIVMPSEFKSLQNSYSESILSHLEIIPYELGWNWTSLPMHWHLFEQLEIHKSPLGFMDQYETMQNVADSCRRDGNDAIVQTSNEYKDEFYSRMQAFGIAKNEPFISIHIRDNDRKDDPRNVTVAHYVPAIEALLNRGYKVVRFGLGKMTKLPEFPGLVDLNLNKFENRFLHIGLMSECRLFVVTNSGPSAVAWTLGTPTLVTNSNNPCLHVDFRTNFMIPKKFYSLDSKRFLNLRTLHTSQFGYSMLSPSSLLKDHRIEIVENSPDEIRDACLEVISAIENNDFICIPELQSLYQNVGAKHKSKLVKSFVTRNPFLVSD